MTSADSARGLFFLRRFLDNPREVGAVCPSTRHLANAMVRGLQLAPRDVVLEYGAGTGSFTPTIAEVVANTPSARYLGIERESGFVDILRRRFPQLTFAGEPVEEVRRLLQEHDLGSPRAIVSGLPLILLPAMESIVRTAEQILLPGGEFRTFSYLHSYPLPSAGRLRRLMKSTFAEFTISKPVVRNFPPALVLRGKKAS